MITPKMRLYLILILPFLFSSCATIFNSPMTVVTVSTTLPSKIVHDSDTLDTKDNKVHLAVRRSSKPFHFQVIRDSVASSDISIRPRSSLAFYGNIAGFGVPGFVVDWTNPKRYGYPREIFVNSADTIAKVYHYDQSDQKGAFYFNLSVPYINSIELKPVGENRQSQIGFWGISVGADYFYKSNKFINISIGGATDYFFPIPIPTTMRDQRMTSLYVSASDNYKRRLLSLGYGVSFARNTWNLFDEREEYSNYSPRTMTKASNSAGLLLSGYIQAGRTLNIGLVYKPYFIRFSRTNIFDYQHVVSLDFVWKFRL